MRQTGRGSFCRSICFLLGVVLSFAAGANPVVRSKFSTDTKYLLVEVLGDDLIHFETSAKLPGPTEKSAIYRTPMVVQKNFTGPSQFKRSGNVLETATLKIEVNASSLCVKSSDKRSGAVLTEICPFNLEQYWKGLSISRANTKNIYGLGQEFRNPGNPDGDWMNSVRHFGGIHGNKMIHFNGGDNGNTQIPILYALGEGRHNFALFLDQVYQQQWDFTHDPGKVEMYGDHIRWFLIGGESLPALRRSYMDLVGRPLVPPKKAFGLWMSEYGYRSWDHVRSVVDSLRGNRFPLDGLMLDLYWFGGVKTDSDDTAMGRLNWDLKNFPDPEATIGSLLRDQAVGIIPIEESYIGKNLVEHAELAQHHLLVKDSSGRPAYITSSTWWGRGGMMDWTNPATGDFWHRLKRLPLIQAGIVGHWLDLGEPEIFVPDAVYYQGNRQPDVHNLYNFRWAEGVHHGYGTYTPDRRPFILSRSGAAGIQRFGVAMWSGDIGADLSSLASHQNTQMHMSLSGIDFYGSDIGGFHRAALKGDLKESYTQWMAYGMLFDIPGRPHTENICQCKQTAPDKVGEPESNRENIRNRYRLIPYLYSLAHLAHERAEPVFPPLVYYYQEDRRVRAMGREKLIGKNLLAGVVANYGQRQTDLYLPEGRWFDFYSFQSYPGNGQEVKGLDLYPGGKFRLPLFAKEGAIIPMMFVDENTMDSFGRRLDGTERTELVVRIFPGNAASEFTLFEDDGISTGYLKGEVRRTLMTQAPTSDGIEISILSAIGGYPGAVSERDNHLEVAVEKTVREVRLNGKTLTGGWDQQGRLLRISTGVMPVSETKRIEVIY